MIKHTALPLALTLILIGCSPDQTVPSQTASPLANQPAPQLAQPHSQAAITAETVPNQTFVKAAEPHVLSAELKSGQSHDQITIKLGKGFQTQAVNTSNLQFLRIWITGPGIADKIYASGGDANGYINIASPTGNAASFSQVPKGTNRVITAQFYDAAKLASTTVYAKGVYSSGTSAPASIVINRAQIPLAEIIENMNTNQSTLLNNINVEQLKTILANVMNWNGTSFSVDPSRFVPIQVVNTLVTQRGIPANLQASLTPGSVYIANTASFQFNVSGLIGNDKVRVRLQDPTSPLLEVGNGPVVINNILPGNWELSVETNAGISYTGLFAPETILFNAGDSLNRANLVLDYSAPTISDLSIRKGPRNSVFVITGANFHTTPATNTVTFTEGINTINALVTEATSTKLTLSVPNVVNSAVQNVTVNLGGKVSAAENFEVQKVIYVKPDNQVINGSLGTSWADAVTLKSAVFNAGSEDEIWIKAGTYNVGTNAREGLVIPREMNLYGGFSGSETNLEQRNLTANPTILSGDTNGDDAPYTIDTEIDDPSRAENAYHVVKVMPAIYVGVTLDSLIIRDGNANDPTEMGNGPPGGGGGGGGGEGGEGDLGGEGGGPAPDAQANYEHSGGGILSLGNVTLNNVIVEKNTADYGAGHASFADRVEYKNTKVRQNHAYDDGGGIYNIGGLQIRDSHFEANRATSGGAIVSESAGEGGMSLFDSVFVNNFAYFSGGALLTQNTSIDVYRNAFIQNTSDGRGGAWDHAVATNGFTDLRDNLFYGNQAATAGGGIALGGNSPRTVNFVNNSFIQNTTAQAFSGQALWWDNNGGALTLVNTLWFGNDLARGSNSPLRLEMNMTNLPDLASLVNENNSGFSAPIDLYRTDAPPAGGEPARYGIDPLFINLANPIGPDGIWKTADDGFVPAPGSILRSAGQYTICCGNRLDITKRNSPPAFSSVGAYESPDNIYVEAD